MIDATVRAYATRTAFSVAMALLVVVPLLLVGSTDARQSPASPRGFATLTGLAHAIDGNRIPDGAIKTVWTKQKTGPLKGIEICACAALRGSVMQRVSCSVYEDRPRVCRVAVVPGDKACRQAREMFQQAIDHLGHEE